MRLLALGIFAIASVTDALDGFLARRLRMQTHLGTVLDPLADKLLLLSGFLGVLMVDSLLYRPPVWITVTIVFRDMMILAGIMIFFMTSGQLRVEPNLLGKTTTVIQIATLILILLQSPAAVPCYYAMAILTIASGLVYARREIRWLKNGTDAGGGKP